MAEKQLWEAKFYSPSSGATVGATPVVVLQYLVVHEGAVCGVLALCFVMAVVLAGFLLYHLRLALRNITTNESFKWSAVRAHAKLARDHARRAHEASGKDSRRERVDKGRDGLHEKIGSILLNGFSRCKICKVSNRFMDVVYDAHFSFVPPFP